jgi:hypothetical protein
MGVQWDRGHLVQVCASTLVQSVAIGALLPLCVLQFLPRAGTRAGLGNCQDSLETVQHSAQDSHIEHPQSYNFFTV